MHITYNFNGHILIPFLRLAHMKGMPAKEFKGVMLMNLIIKRDKRFKKHWELKM